ncbi:MAG: bifunctional folylpolyglutamate synthase/dihydrofolate synthase [Porticoccaceae bacterium]|nr:bifunctional folylpolyglutamate synthase/dihydrofolate synthase [Porticoccaceae bacterium]
MPNRSLSEWLADIEARHPVEIELGLERVSTVWKRLKGDAEQTSIKTPKTIVVAGTNGKGSCVAVVQSVLVAHGYSVGAFTSPHFLRYNERICIDGVQVSDQDIVNAFEKIEMARDEIRLTYFEFNTLAALVIFMGKPLDIIVLEVGLGGRLDAVNIIDADVSVVTSVDIDHQDWLGDTREKIAREKLGIARSNVPLLVGEQNLPVGFTDRVNQSGARPIYYGTDFYSQTDADGETFSAILTTHQGTQKIAGLSLKSLLPVNVSLGLQALCNLNIELLEQHCHAALECLDLNGRRQLVRFKGVNVVLDVAHNPAAAAMLASFVPPCSGKTIAVAAVLNDKDWAGIVKEMMPVIDVWSIGEITDNQRAMDTRSLFDIVYNAGLEGESYSSIQAAFREAVEKCSIHDQLVVFGSFSVVSAVLTIISEEG